MNNLPNFQNATFESVWASFQETDRRLSEMFAKSDRKREKSQEDFDRRMKESQEDFDRRMKESREESDRKREKSQEDFDKRMKEADKQRKKSQEDFDKRMKEADRRMKESREDSDKRIKEADRLRKESQEDFDRRMKEEDRRSRKSQREFEKRMKKLEELTGGIANNNGEMAEEYFFNAFRKNKTFANETFEKVLRNRCIKNGIWHAEFDLLLLNGKSVAIIEVKYRAKHDNISIERLISRIEPFKVLFPDYKNHTIYLGVAAMSFHKILAKELHEAGIATIHQEGKKMVKYDQEVRKF